MSGNKKSRLDIEIDNQNEKIRKIEEDNKICRSLEKYEETLKELENSWISRKYFILLLMLQNRDYNSVGGHCGELEVVGLV